MDNKSADAKLKGVIKTRSKAVKRALATVDGKQLLKVLEETFDGDTFDSDPYRHAYFAGSRAVLIWMRTYNNLKDEDNEDQIKVEDIT